MLIKLLISCNSIQYEFDAWKYDGYQNHLFELFLKTKNMFLLLLIHNPDNSGSIKTNCVYYPVLTIRPLPHQTEMAKNG